MTFVFFGTSSHSRDFLELLKEHKFLPELIVTKPPRPIGRKRIFIPNPCEIFAKENNVPFVTTQDIEILRNWEIGLILDYSRLIPVEIINLFPKGIINIHFSKLPQFRGASPTQYTILTRQKSAWITWYLIDKGLDTGPLLYQCETPLKMTENTNELYAVLGAKAAELTKKNVEDYLAGRISPVPQPTTISGEKLIRAERLTTKFCQVDWSKPPEDIDALIRASNPDPGAWTMVKINGQIKRLKLLKSRLEKGKLILEEVQLEGKRPVEWKQFKKAYPEVFPSL